MNNQIPLVSIICTTYNHESYIAQAIEGFLMQKTNFPIEIIVHDDASTDNTANIIKEYEAKYPNLFVTIYQSENQYSKKDVNIWTDITFPVARGNYIAICEGDDYWIDPYKLQKQIDFLENNLDYGLVFSDADILFNNSGKINKSFDRSKNRNIPYGNVFKRLIYSNPYKTCTALYKKSAIDNYSKSINTGQFMIGDWGLWLYISRFQKVGYLNESTAVYRILQNSASHFNTYEDFKTYVERINQLRRYFAVKFNFKISATKVFFMNLRAYFTYMIKYNKYKSFLNYLLPKV